jgi:hypothetical protein
VRLHFAEHAAAAVPAVSHPFAHGSNKELIGIRLEPFMPKKMVSQVEYQALIVHNHVLCQLQSFDVTQFERRVTAPVARATFSPQLSISALLEIISDCLWGPHTHI